MTEASKPGDADFIKGHISTEHTVWCGRCPNWELLAEHTVRSMISAVKSIRWKTHKTWGWLCPYCVKELADGQKDVGYRPVER